MNELVLGVTVCVITRRRPERLERLLDALRDCQPHADLDWVSTVVVDNDGDKSAKAVVAAARLGFPTELRYLNESQPGVSHARNRAVAAVRTTHLAFIDDDMIPEPNWLFALSQGLTESGADATIGPVPIAFEGPVDPELADSGVLDFPEWEDGQQVDTIRTGNVLIARAVLPDPAFDPRLSACGGEDHMLGRYLSAQGTAIVYVADAVATEWTTADRLLPQALRDRQKRLGFAYTSVDLLLAGTGGSARTRAAHCFTGVARILVGSGMSLPGLRGRMRWRSHRLRWFGFGQLQAARGNDLIYYGA